MKKLLGSFFLSPLLWGGLATFGFYAAIHRGLITDPLILRYTAGHPVENITVAMFLVGMTSLLFKYIRLLRQRRTLALGSVFAPMKPEREETDRASDYLAAIEKAREFRGNSIHLNRLRRAMVFLQSTGRADELDTELRALAEDDALDAERDYGMVRMFIWAIPILGFLGTVVGITMALGNLDLTELETSSRELAVGLNVAFDTTALALSLVFFLYFSLFFVQRVEGKLFERIDRLVDSELKGRFVRSPSPQEQEEFRTVRRMLKSVADSFDRMLQTQIERWNEAVTRVEQQSDEVMRKGADKINQTLRDSLHDSVAQHARTMIAGEEKLLSDTLTPYIRGLKENGEKLVSLQEQITEEGKLFRDILRATGEVTMLEERLNQNLRSLSEANCFSETVHSLAATIHLLNAKLGGNYAALGESRPVPAAERSDVYDVAQERFEERNVLAGDLDDDLNDESNESDSYRLPGRRSFTGRKVKRGKTA